MAPCEEYGAKYAGAVECLTKDRDALLAFYNFPAERWDHVRTTNPIESVFTTVRHRTVRTKGALSGHRQADGLQAHYGGIQNLASASGRKPVAQGHPRRQIPRRHRGQRADITQRRLKTSSPNFRYSSTVYQALRSPAC
jgi:hypothetical protein